MTGEGSGSAAPRRAEQVRSWRASEFGGLEFLHGQFTTLSFGRHTHATYSIGLLTQGGMTFERQGARYLQRPGLIGVINPEQPHTGKAESEHGWTYRNFYPAPEQMLAFAAAGRAQPVELPPVIEDPELLRALVTAHRAFEEPASRLARESLMLAALSALVLRHGRRAPPPPRVGREARCAVLIKQKLEDDCAVNVSLAELAALTGLSRFAALRAFRQSAGLPPHTYQLQVRLRRAKLLLQAGESPAAVAAALGFADQSHFGKHFRRTYGLTPGQYLSGLGLCEERATTF